MNNELIRTSMRIVQDAYYINGIPYQKLSDDSKIIIDRAVEKLKTWEVDRLILDYEDRVLNLITNHPAYTFLIQSEYPKDLTGKMVSAYTLSLEESK